MFRNYSIVVLVRIYSIVGLLLLSNYKHYLTIFFTKSGVFSGNSIKFPFKTFN